jgi:hypothetical protein
MTSEHVATTSSRRAGTFVTVNSGVDGYRAFLPRPLPPTPPLEISAHT